MSSLFEVNRKYNFEVFPVPILGSDFKNVVILGVITADIAQNFLDIDAVHTQVYPYLPSGSQDDPRSYDYVMLKTMSGEKAVLGIPWINQDTVVNVESGTMVVEISNVTSTDIQRVSDSLTANGYNQFKIVMRNIEPQ